MKTFSCLVACVLFSACSSVPISSDRATETTRIVQSDYLTQSSDRTVKVVVIQDDVFGPSAIKPKIFIDGKEIGSLSQGEKITFYVAPGVHQLAWSALTKGNYREQEFQISEEMHNVFHLASPAGDVIRFVRDKYRQ